MTNICSIFVVIKLHVHNTIIFEHKCRVCSSVIINYLKLSIKYLQSNGASFFEKDNISKKEHS